MNDMTPMNTQYMSLYVEHADLTAGVAFLMRTLEKHKHIPILANILFPGDGTMQATDLDQTATWRLTGLGGGFVPEHQAFTVTADSLQRAIKGANKGCLVSFAIEAVDDEPAGRVVVSADGMVSKLQALPVCDFPVDMPYMKPSPTAVVFHMTAARMAAWLGFIAPCISTEETRYYLNGVFLNSRRGVLSAVATDGHKLGIMDTDHAWPVTEGRGPWNSDGIIWPKKAVNTVISALGKKATGYVQLTIGPIFVKVEHEQWSVVSKHIDGTFPDYTRVIPSLGKGFAGVNVDDAQKAITRLVGVLGKQGGAIHVDTRENTVGAKNGNEPTTLALTFTDVAEQVKDADDCNTVLDGFGVNPAYLKDALAAFSDCGVVHFTWDEGSPIRFQGVSWGWNADCYIEGVRIVMPMRY